MNDPEPVPVHPARFKRKTSNKRGSQLWLAGLPLLLATFSAPAADLMEIYRQAQARDPVYRGAVYALQAARERVPQARAALLPAVNLVGAASRQAGQASFNELAPVTRDVHNRSWNLQLTQPLWRAASRAALDQAGQQELLAEAQFRQAEQDLILRTAQAYLDVLVAQEAEHVAQLQTGAMEQQRSLARRTFEGGTGTVTDVHEAQSRLDLSRAQAVVAGNELQNKLAELTRILGCPMPAWRLCAPTAPCRGSSPKAPSRGWTAPASNPSRCASPRPRWKWPTAKSPKARRRIRRPWT